jgi:hypothetical protein
MEKNLLRAVKGEHYFLGQLEKSTGILSFSGILHFATS